MEVHNTNVFKNKSKIICSNTNLVVGDGLFASRKINKGEIVCTYGGCLVDCATTQYMDPMYIVSWEFGKGFKLVGDDKDRDMGHFANSVHPENPNLSQNARFLVTEAKKKFYKENTERARFNIVATKDIHVEDEIIVDYGKYYWYAMEKFIQKGQHIIFS
jgi:hypothetical protein